jgi:predicted ATP-grasp superfamily ATP-dependent carboligase
VNESQPRRLIVLGASARSAANSAARAGFEPYAIDLFADRDLAALCSAVRIDRYPVEFLQALAHAPSAPWMYTGGLENYPRLVTRLAALRPLWGNRADTLQRVRDPWDVERVLRKEGLACPELWSAGSPSQGRWLFKPRRGSAGLGVRFATDHDFKQTAERAVLQKYVEGESGSATFVAARGRAVLLGATRQIVGRDWGRAPEFLYVGSLAPLPLTELLSARLAHLGGVLAERFGLVGLFGVDFIRTEHDLWPVEVNPRYTASVEVLERLTGRSFVGIHAKACAEGELPEAPPEPSGSFAGKAVVYARRDCVWRDRSLAEIADVPNDGQHFHAGQPIATVFAIGDSLAAVETKLKLQSAALLDAIDESRANEVQPSSGTRQSSGELLKSGDFS